MKKNEEDKNVLFRYVHKFEEEVKSTPKFNSYDCSFSDKTADKFNKDVLNWLTKKTNRSVNQTKFLYNMVGSFELLLELEEAVKALHVYYCPGDLAEALYLVGKFRTWKAMGWVESVPLGQRTK